LQDTNSRLALLSVEVSVTFDTRIWEDSSWARERIQHSLCSSPVPWPLHMVISEGLKSSLPFSMYTQLIQLSL
jgi:hypothetical protein